MKIMDLIGRVLFALIFIAATPRHFTAEAIAHAADFGTPLAGFLVPLSGLMACLGGFSVIFGYRTRAGACLLVAFLLPVTLIMHPFWSMENPRETQFALSMFAKNVSMLGAAIILFAAGPGPWSIDGRQARTRVQAESGRRSIAV